MKKIILVITASAFLVSCSSSQKISKENQYRNTGNYNLAGIGSDRAK